VRFAADSGAGVVLFPEYVGSSLLALGGGWERWNPHLGALFSRLAREHSLVIVGGSRVEEAEGTPRNVSHVYFPEGQVVAQPKLHPTPFERNVWGQSGSDLIEVFDLPFGRAAVAVCYDVEFPELVRAAARAGVVALFVPSWTDDFAGFHRVRLCAQARCIENQIVVAHAPLVGGLDDVPAYEQGRGRAAILSPCDVAFPADGVVAQGAWDADECVVGEVDFAMLTQARANGTVTPLADSRDSTSYRVALR
jgi:predicted amidohydrolase